MKTFKFSLVLLNTDVFISLDDSIYGIHRKRINILYLFYGNQWNHSISEMNKNDIFTQWQDTVFPLVKNNMGSWGHAIFTPCFGLLWLSSLFA